MAIRTTRIVFILFYFTVFEAYSNELVNLFTLTGERQIAELVRLTNDTLYVRVHNPDSTYAEKALHKSLLSKVIFFSGEYLNLELSNYNPGELTQSAAPTATKGDSIVSTLPTIAVTDFEPRGGVSENDAQTLSDRFRERLIATGQFRVMERNEMDIILKEQGFQQTGACRDNQCLVEMGQLIAVQKIVSGSIGKVGGIYTVSAKLLDVATGSIDRTVSEDCDCPIELVLASSIERLACKMANITLEDDTRADGIKGKASLFITSIPDGAQIFINGNKYEATTPATVRDIVSGDLVIKVIKSIGGIERTGQQAVRALSNVMTQIEINLLPGQTALQIETTPEGAEVYINKKQSIDHFPRFHTPIIIANNVLPGSAAIHLFKPGYSDTTLQIDVKPKVLNKVAVELVPLGNPEKIIQQNTFTTRRLQRGFGKWTLLVTAVGMGLTSYFAYETWSNYTEAVDARDQLKKPEVRNNPSLYKYYLEQNSTHYYDYRFNLKAFLAALGTTCLAGGAGIVLYF